jgi:hypothetical protein
MITALKMAREYLEKQLGMLYQIIVWNRHIQRSQVPRAGWRDVEAKQLHHL